MKTKKLNLKKETLVALAPKEVTQVNGGALTKVPCSGWSCIGTRIGYCY